MTLAIEYFSTSGNATAAGVYIPIASLPGLTSTELESGDADKESKVLLALCNKIFDVLNPTNFDKLGFAVTKGQPTGAGTDIINQNYSYTNTFVVNHAANTLLQIPVPSSGSFSDVGKFRIVEVFPNAVAVAASGSVAGAGIVINALTAYGGPTQSEVSSSIGDADGDDRQWFAALLQMLVNDSTVRTTDTASAVIVKSRSNAAGVAPSTAFTDATNPTTGITSAQLPLRSFFSITYSITLQLALNQATQTFDVRHVTA
ncbi:MAG: hypothetical protein SFY66_18660 [Oculatellaceae cyanobacterium bins.114]|nr:hypothetical protein [Oculatellaceae cyanobacterium bins.114]